MGADCARARVIIGVLHRVEVESNARVVDIVSLHPYISLTSPHSSEAREVWMATRKKSKARTKKKATKKKATKKKAAKRKTKKKAGKKKAKKKATKKRRGKAAAPAADAAPAA